MALHARATGHERFCWFVLNDNALAQSFYRSLGATEDPEWRRWIMPTNALNRLVEGTEDRLRQRQDSGHLASNSAFSRRAGEEQARCKSAYASGGGRHFPRLRVTFDFVGPSAVTQGAVPYFHQ
jgi:hypothetical protein